jgi:hypothetical protein
MAGNASSPRPSRTRAGAIQTTVPFEQWAEERRRRLRLRLILFGLGFAAATVGLVVVSYTKWADRHFADWLIFLVQHTAIGLLVAALAAVLIPLVIKSTELFDKLVEFFERTQTTALLEGSASLSALQKVGISDVYPSRDEADADIASELEKANEIRVLGISLGDWTSKRAPLAETWNALKAAITSYDPKRQIDVKILLADPRSLGAVLRSQAEAEAGKTSSLKVDVEDTIRTLKALRDKSPDGRTTCELRLYRVAPQLFICQTESVGYVQPYYLREKQGPRRLPLVRCVDKDVLGDLRNHFDMIWEFAAIPAGEYLDAHVVGIDDGAYSTASANIFSATDTAAGRMRTLIARARERVWLQGISLDSYFSDGHRSHLYNAVKRAIVAGTDVRILLLHPYSTQAYYRSYREYLLSEENDISFDDYCDSGGHENSTLVQNAKRTLRRILWLMSTRENLHVKLYASAPFAFMLLSDESALIEQYHYGTFPDSDERTDELEDRILGKDMPVVEYKRTYEGPREWHLGRSPYTLVESHFDFLWDHLAIPANKAIDLDQKSGRERAVALETPGMMLAASTFPAPESPAPTDTPCPPTEAEAEAPTIPAPATTPISTTTPLAQPEVPAATAPASPTPEGGNPSS